MKINLVIICIDGARLDSAKSSSVFNSNIPGSVFFSQSITYAPYTNSSLHAVFSGADGNRNGCFSYWHSLKFKKDSFKTLTEYLHENDYYTHADLHSKLAIPPQGFDIFDIYDETQVDYSNRHENLLNMMKNKVETGKNFFLYLHYSGIHMGILNSVLKAYDNYSKEYFENRALNEKRYDVLFHDAEEYLQNIFNKLTELELWKDTIVVILSDHGISIGEKIGERAYGAFCYDYTIRTFVCYIFSEFEKKEVNQQVRHVDFMPTILEYFNIKMDKKFEKIDGVSLIPLIKGQKMEEKIAYSETANPLNEKAPPKKPNTKSVRTSEWKLIFNEYNNTKELYNLKNDPNEETNLIGKALPIENTLWIELQKLMNY